MCLPYRSQKQRRAPSREEQWIELLISQPMSDSEVLPDMLPGQQSSEYPSRSIQHSSQLTIHIALAKVSECPIKEVLCSLN
jgi:hypothetical protein